MRWKRVYEQTFRRTVRRRKDEENMKIIFATGNSGKLREAAEILGNEFTILSPSQLGHPEDIPETGKTLTANSLLKAQYIHQNIGGNCFADDTGLEVEILGDAPGVETARYAGESKDPVANMDKLTAEMARMECEASMAREYGLNTVHASRKASFRTIVTLILDGKAHYFEGRMDGRIALGRSGNGGFGYDPIFIPDELPEFGEDGSLKAMVPNAGRLTIAEMSEEQKNIISHRGKALRAMADFLHSLRK